VRLTRLSEGRIDSRPRVRQAAHGRVLPADAKEVSHPRPLSLVQPRQERGSAGLCVREGALWVTAGRLVSARPHCFLSPGARSRRSDLTASETPMIRYMRAELIYNFAEFLNAISLRSVSTKKIAFTKGLYGWSVPCIKFKPRPPAEGNGPLPFRRWLPSDAVSRRLHLAPQRAGSPR
jgi:hypothetical protein